MKRIELSLGNSIAWAGLALSSVALTAGTAFAQSSDGTGIPTPRSVAQQQSGGVPLGPMTAYPSVSYDISNNDNITLQSSSSGQVFSDTIQTLKPAVRVEGKSGTTQFGAGLGFDSGRYSKSTADNYDDNNAFASLDWNPDTRVKVRLNANYIDGHDPRGSTVDPLTPTPNVFRQNYLGGIFGFGAQGAQGRFELEASGFNKRYYNNRDVTAANDRDESVYGGTFYWRVAPRTSLLAQYKRLDVDMKQSTSLLDSKTDFYLVGVTWEATAATTGVFKIGQIKRDYSSPATSDFAGHTGWEGQVLWAPLTYSKLEFATARLPRETASNFGSFIWSTNYGAKWTHAWTSQFSTAAGLSYMEDAYQGVNRTDKYNTAGVRATYQMRRWLSFGADANYQKRDSNDNTADYTRNIFLLFVSATL